MDEEPGILLSLPPGSEMAGTGATMPFFFSGNLDSVLRLQCFTCEPPPEPLDIYLRELRKCLQGGANLSTQCFNHNSAQKRLKLWKVQTEFKSSKQVQMKANSFTHFG